MPRPSIDPKHRASCTRPARAVLRPARSARPGPAKHRAARPQRLLRGRTARTAALPGLALAAAGAVVAAGLVAVEGPTAPPAALTAQVDTAAAAADPEMVERMKAARSVNLSRSDRREDADPPEPRQPRQPSQRAQSRGRVTGTVDLGAGDPRATARALLGEFGFSSDQFPCLDALWTKESGWNVSADNPTSSAYGIPQALPGSKMSSAGADWATNPATQIRWGLGYIAATYGSPCGAWSHSQANDWY